MDRTEFDRRRANEETFADANEQISDAAVRHRVDPVPILCECSATNCMELIHLPLDAYRKVRETGGFVIRPGHDDPHVEHVIDEGDGYQVVEKFR
jgi:hypothetical protein